jgi:hypothetical protein
MVRRKVQRNSEAGNGSHPGQAAFYARKFETETETSNAYGYGFYIKRGHTYILWIGIWDAAPTPLSFGFSIEESHWLRPKKPPVAPSTAGGYQLWPLEPQSWDDPEKIFSTVNQFLQSYDGQES